MNIKNFDRDYASNVLIERLVTVYRSCETAEQKKAAIEWILRKHSQDFVSSIIVISAIRDIRQEIDAKKASS